MEPELEKLRKWMEEYVVYRENTTGWETYYRVQVDNSSLKRFSDEQDISTSRRGRPPVQEKEFPKLYKYDYKLLVELHARAALRSLRKLHAEVPTVILDNLPWFYSNLPGTEGLEHLVASLSALSNDNGKSFEENYAIAITQIKEEATLKPEKTSAPSPTQNCSQP